MLATGAPRSLTDDASLHHELEYYGLSKAFFSGVPDFAEGRLYVVGGFMDMGMTAGVERYDPDSNTSVSLG